MSKTCLFYATRDDLLAVTEKVESIIAIRYVRFGSFTKLPDSFSSATEIPNLGVASHPSAVACEKFLICELYITIKPEMLKASIGQGGDGNSSTVKQIATSKTVSKNAIGADRFIIDQLLNPDTITFTAGGLWNNDILLHGSIGTASQSKSSLILMKTFHDVLKKQFIKVRAFYVGPQALVLLKNGKRLTISAQSPQKFDLTLL